ncbi:hypothetical protein PENSPDRAFT_671014 [Peniophora sp. CONT]|nr:hypothetical protein PENSPDRAFT_671014 [Peniophora sp. CONT]
MSHDSSLEDSLDLSEFTADELGIVDCAMQHLAPRPFTFAEVDYHLQPAHVQIHARQYGPTGVTSFAISPPPNIGVLEHTSTRSPQSLSNELGARSSAQHAGVIANAANCSEDRTAASQHGDGRSVDHRVVGTPSPYTLFRAQRKAFSVSDLTGPAWCEVQFDYGLRQHRWKKSNERPSSFLSANNKTIHVDQDVASRNDRVMGKGSVIHENLERRLRPDMTHIQIGSDSERWAVRILRVIMSLYDLKIHGFCREMPAFGILHGHVVHGVIVSKFLEEHHSPLTHIEDEITIRGDSLPYFGQASSTGAPVPSQSSQSASSPVDIPTMTSSTLRDCDRLCLSDTKTRGRDDLPTDDDALPARLQLMIYRRLLLVMLSSSFPWTPMWEQLHIDSSQTLDDEFLTQASRTIPTIHLERGYGDVFQPLPNTLNGFAALLRASIRALGTVRVDQELSIIYRSQTTSRERKASVQNAELAQAALEAELLQEDGAIPELARMVAANILKESLEEDDSYSTDDTEPPVIGVTTFDMNNNCLDAHLVRVFAWWLGERSPEGVSLNDTRRCNFCEYMQDCEWREQKALENDKRFNIHDHRIPNEPKSQ